ncbi:glycosyltransferase [Winogradskyella sediminis]|uniref:Glycosyltransferase involved in cell wall bisynthesis n=1 Tax=Winogradskyella sediminis TaxID=1382466 RepID=A0A1H1PVK9_9FLAO|nr:glycosyltransferase [Winogradskyella sediminis]SDS14749.1 Glycosyltransferase involved in cell wall bisynthesis [Winogradskyella sediminis]
MHITFILQDMYRLGAQYVTSMIANGLSKRGHKIDLIVSAIESKIANERPDLEPFPLNDEINKLELTHLKASKNISEIRRYLLENQPDVIMPMSSNYALATAMAMLFLPIKTKFMPVEHSGGIGMNLDKGSKLNILSRWATKFTSYIMFNKIDGVIAVSNGVKEAMVASKCIKPEKIHVIYNPVISEQFYDKISQNSKHRWLKNKSSFVIVAAGAHVPIKGYDILIHAMAEVNKTHICKLIIYGEGVLTSELENLANSLNVGDSVDFPGHTKNLPAELKSADAFVVSSHAESFSVVLVEALASKIPVVASNCPSGPAEILSNGKFGILVKPGDPKALAKGIIEVINGGGILPKDESWSPYELGKVVTNYDKVIMSVINN